MPVSVNGQSVVTNLYERALCSVGYLLGKVPAARAHSAGTQAQFDNEQNR